jgi:hypothetical protein
MKKKLAFILTGSLCIWVLVYGMLAFAEQSSASQPSDEAQGALISINGPQNTILISEKQGEHEYPLAKSVWVYLNQKKANLADLKPGVQLVVIMNNKKQAAYIKAAAQAATPTPSAASPSASVQPTATPAAAPSATVTPGAATAAPQAAWGELSIQADGPLSLKISQKRSQTDVKSEVQIQTQEKAKIRLEGKEAQDIIVLLLKTVDLKAPHADQQLAGRIAELFSLEAAKVQVHVQIKWIGVKPQPTAAPVQQQPQASQAAATAKPAQPTANPVLPAITIKPAVQQQDDEDGQHEVKKSKENGKPNKDEQKVLKAWSKGHDKQAKHAGNDDNRDNHGGDSGEHGNHDD